MESDEEERLFSEGLSVSELEHCGESSKTDIITEERESEEVELRSNKQRGKLVVW